MLFLKFCEDYFSGNKEEAIRHLAHESYYNDFSLTGSSANLQAILDDMTREEAKVFMRYFRMEQKANPSAFRVYVITTELSSEEKKKKKTAEICSIAISIALFLIFFLTVSYEAAVCVAFCFYVICVVIYSIRCQKAAKKNTNSDKT